MAMPWIDKAPAVLLTWLPGEEGPDAMAEILFGRVAPSGRLPVTFPKKIEDNPSYPYYPGGDTTTYGEGVFVGYRHYDRSNSPPLFAFGHGLTYTSFSYDSIEASGGAKSGDALTVQVRITNTGARPGVETVQLYLQPNHPSVPRPIKELRGFAKIDLAPAESRTVSFSLTDRDFAFFDPDQNRWIAEPGTYDVVVGGSAADPKLRQTITRTA